MFSDLSKNFNIERGNIKIRWKKIPGINTIIEMKDTLDGINSGIDEA